jgi:Domain of unknown function (DUF4365)
MEYTKRNRHGDIGEHLVAFRVMKLIQWPCRLLNIDLGVGAEVEILSPDGHATGDTVKLQIKSRESLPANGSFSISVTDDHISYWSRFSAPVVFCGVCLATERVFWHQITALGNYETSGESMAVTFRCEHDQLTAQTADSWRRLATPPEARKLKELMTRYAELADLTQNGAADLETVAEYDIYFAEAAGIATEITNLLALMPWKITGVDLDKFERIKRRLRIASNDNARNNNELRFY